MRGIVTEHNQARPKPSKAETKADVTDHVARAIIGAEIESREAKTARLRQARLQAETKLAASAPPEKPRNVKSTTPRRAPSSK